MFTDFLKVHKGNHIKMVSGFVSATIDLGDGNDTFKGGAKAETVKDGNGGDSVNLGSGNDTYIATGSSGTDANDTVNGGSGTDTYDASAASSNLTINLDTRTHTEPTGLNFFERSSAAQRATDGNLGDINTDTIIGFENTKGGSGADVIFGSASANSIEGGDSNDDLFGFGGNDTIDGGAGQDFIVGGAGRDILTGGASPDTFWYLATTDSGVTAATRDVITDFQDDGPGGDVIALSQIDADTTQAGDQAFSFIGTNVN
jgi:Ca2+-binding RTX toxin-like protein